MENVRAAQAGIRPELPEALSALCVLVGNTKALWQPFLEHCRREPEWLDATEDPLDTYCELMLHRCLSQVTTIAVDTPCASPLFLSSQRGSPLQLSLSLSFSASKQLSAQRQRCRQPRVVYINKQTPHREGAPGWLSAHSLGAAAGLCALEATSHLSLHATYGAWFSLRSVVVFDGVPWRPPAPPAALPAVALPAARATAVRAAAAAARAPPPEQSANAAVSRSSSGGSSTPSPLPAAGSASAAEAPQAPGSTGSGASSPSAAASAASAT